MSIGNSIKKMDPVKWSQRFVLGVVILVALALLVFIFKVILIEGLLGIMHTIIGVAFIAVFFHIFWRVLYREWDAIKVEGTELIAETDPEIIKLKSQLEEEKQRRRVVDDELRKTKQALREVKFTTLPTIDGLDLDELAQKYDVVIVEKGLNNPFKLSSDMVKIAVDITAKAEDDLAKAKLLFDWMQESIQYDFEKLREIEEQESDTYKDSVEVFEYQTGVCGEQAILYVAMSRTADLTSNYVSVRVDHSGKSVRHACASVSLPEHTILVDPAYHTFDVRHQQYEILNDEEAARRFKSWDQKDT